MEDKADQDRDLADRIRSGDRDALGALYDRYAPQALAAALRLAPDRAAAEDVVHDAFVAAWRRMDLFDPARGSLRAWLLTIVRNRAIDRGRGSRPTVEVSDPDAQPALASGPNPTWSAAIARLSASELRTAIEALPAEQREAIELAYFRGHTYREIAAITGVPEGTANGRLRLALAKLRDALRLTDAAPLASGRLEAEAVRVRKVDR